MLSDMADENNSILEGHVSTNNESSFSWSSNYTDNTMLFALVDGLDLYYLPIMIIIGLVGNTVSFVVFVFSGLNKLSLSVYLSALAVSDNLFLLSLGVVWLDNTRLRLFHREGWCQLTVYLSYACSFLSVWLIVSYTLERYIVICHPMQRVRLCTISRARIVVVCLCVGALSIYACTLRMSGIAGYENHGYFCTPYLSEYYYQIHLGLTYADTIITFIVPFAVILGFNIHIFRKMRFFYRQKSEHVPIASHQHCPPHFHRHPNTQEVCHHNQGQIKVTKLLLILSTVFLVMTAPSYVIRIRIFMAELILGGFSSMLHDALLQQLFQYLFYLNYSINIVVYLICWSKFRTVVRNFFLRTKARLVKFARAHRCMKVSQSTDSFPTSAALVNSVTDYL